MTQKHPEAITVELGGEDRVLKISVAAFRLAKLKHGVTLSLHDMDSGDLSVMATLVWIALLPDDPAVTEDQVLVWLMDSPDEMDILKQTMDAVKRFAAAAERLGNSLPAGEEEAKAS